MQPRAPREGQDMRHIGHLLPGLLFILSVASTDGFARAGRRVCAAAPQSRAVTYTESHVQPVYQPYLTTCQGHRLCSTYRTIYRVAYRQAYRQVPQPAGSCCPGWSRVNSHALGCDRALCWVPCQNGGTCTFPGRCACPPGWMGRACQTDVDECAGQGHGCGQLCINTAGSYHCACWDGFSLAADEKVCQPLVPAAEPETFSQAVTKESLYHPNYLLSRKSSHCSICKGDRAHPQHAVAILSIIIVILPQDKPGATKSSGHRWYSSSKERLVHVNGPPSEMKEEMNELKSRVEALEQKLQLVLAPFHNLMPSAPEDVGADPISRLSHSLQQLDRIDSLSEQISFLEERLETCSCKNEL